MWHTHLKKRLKQNKANTEIIIQSTNCNSNSPKKSESSDLDILPSHQAYASMSPPQPSSSDFSSLTYGSITQNNMGHINGTDDMDLSESFPEIDESLWSEPPLAETTSNMPSDLFAVASYESQAQSQFNPIETVESGYNYDSILDEDMSFWYNLFIRAGGSTELSES